MEKGSHLLRSRVTLYDGMIDDTVDTSHTAQQYWQQIRRTFDRYNTLITSSPTVVRASMRISHSSCNNRLVFHPEMAVVG
jgi:hypothetical protein